MNSVKHLRRFSEWLNPLSPHVIGMQIDIPAIPPVVRQGETLENKRRRLLWSSRKRGILETDLLLSTFFQKHMMSMDAKQLEEYDSLLNEPDWDIYYW
jgi:succinate dehydrogenase assembly factor 2